jgi:GT2 family glycosyltransferase
MAVPVSTRIPTFVVIPVKGRLDLTCPLVTQLAEDGGYETLFVLDNGSTDGTWDWLHRRSPPTGITGVAAPGLGIYEMWNLGVRLARAREPLCNIAILNNDLRIGPRFLARMAAGLRSHADLSAVSANYDQRAVDGIAYVRSTFKRRGLAGFAFMARGEVFDRLSFDEGFRWWYGDDDFVCQVEAAGGRVGIVGEAIVDHLGGGGQTVRYTSEVLAAIARDRRRRWAKWGHF